MSRKTQRSHESQRPNYPLRRLAAVGLLATTAFALKAGVDKVGELREQNEFHAELSKPDTMKSYLHGDIDPSRVTVIKAEDESTVWELAKKLHGEGDPRVLSGIIGGQDMASTIPGVQRGESFVVPYDQLEHPEDYPNPSADTDPTISGVQIANAVDHHPTKAGNQK